MRSTRSTGRVGRRARTAGGSRLGTSCTFDGSSASGWPRQEVVRVESPRRGRVPPSHRLQHELLLTVHGHGSRSGVSVCHGSGRTGRLGLDVFFHPAGVGRGKSTRWLIAARSIQSLLHVLVKASVGQLVPLVDLTIPHHLEDKCHVEQVCHFVVEVCL